MCPGDMKRVGELTDGPSPGDILNPRHGVRYLIAVVLIVVEVEFVAGCGRRRVTDEAHTRAVAGDVQLVDDRVDKVEYRPPVETRRITAADGPRTVNHEDDIRPRRLTRYCRYKRTHQQLQVSKANILLITVT